jgi:predicted RNA-binding protein YlxR (DUF448 family)
MRRKHVPQRTCVACRQVRPKKELIRIVRSPEGDIEVDETGKKSGRGAYLCRNKACWEIALAKSKLEYALETEIRVEEKDRLWQHSRSLPDTPPQQPSR